MGLKWFMDCSLWKCWKCSDDYTFAGFSVGVFSLFVVIIGFGVVCLLGCDKVGVKFLVHVLGRTWLFGCCGDLIIIGGVGFGGERIQCRGIF